MRKREKVYDYTTIVSYTEGMAFGAIDALTENGLISGKDVRIYTTEGSDEKLRSFDGGMVRFFTPCWMFCFHVCFAKQGMSTSKRNSSVNCDSSSGSNSK